MTGVLSLKNSVRNLDQSSVIPYLTCFSVPKAEELVVEADKAEREGNREKASELYL